MLRKGCDLATGQLSPSIDRYPEKSRILGTSSRMRSWIFPNSAMLTLKRSWQSRLPASGCGMTCRGIFRDVIQDCPVSRDETCIRPSVSSDRPSTHAPVLVAPPTSRGTVAQTFEVTTSVNDLPGIQGVRAPTYARFPFFRIPAPTWPPELIPCFFPGSAPLEMSRAGFFEGTCASF